MPTARLDAEILLGHLLKMSRMELYLAWERPLYEEEKEASRELLKRRAQGEPVAYIVGEKEFYSRPFFVDKRALIPRPSTETLVEQCLLRLENLEAPELLDLGTGSGVLAVTLAMEKNGPVLAADICPEALALAGKNVERHGLKEKVQLAQSDLFAEISGGPFDAIVTNPPYVSPADKTGLMADVRDFEPHLALFAEEEGLAVIRRILAEALDFLKPGGWLCLEFGWNQRIAIEKMLDSEAWTNASFHSDLEGHDRVLCVQKNEA